MKTANVTYLENLKVLSTHIRSGQEIMTEAPIDNNGKGDAFSPIDLLVTSLITCMITEVGIAAKKNDWRMGTVKGEVDKIMTANPRRVAAINIEIVFQGHGLNDLEKSLIEQIALNCPVAQSIHPDIVSQVKFRYD